jgi:hypothetical protein
MTQFTIARMRVTAAAFVVSILGAVCEADGQELKIGIIDLYGLSRVSTGQVREALTFKEGDTVLMGFDERPGFVTASEARLSTLPGVARARINPVCCDQGRVIVYVGIEERGTATMHLRPAPMGTARLAADIVQSGEEFLKAFILAVQRGDAAEDHSQGHAFTHDPATRAIQERFVVYAKRDLPQLRRVLRSSSDAVQRALAAQVLGYASDKKAMVEDLVQGMSDPSDEVRNNAMRALLVFADAAPGVSGSIPRVPAERFIDFLNSPVWSDRNKASAALMALSARRDPGLLATLRKKALASLVEMARWKSEGHAFAAFTILGRIAGYSDETARGLWDRGDREVVIEAAIKRQ